MKRGLFEQRQQLLRDIKNSYETICQNGACVGSGRNFHPDTSVWSNVKDLKAICAKCPVEAECLVFAVYNSTTTFGVWGGATEKERRNAKRKYLLRFDGVFSYSELISNIERRKSVPA